MFRKRFLLLFIAAAVGIGLLLIEDYTNDQAQENVDSASKLPDYYGEGLNNRSYANDGQFEGRFIASHSIHYPAQQLTQFRDPEIHSVADDGKVWLIKSLEGVHQETLDTMTFRQQVLITPVVQAVAPTRITTSELVVFNQDKLAKTDKPVTVINAGGQIDAVGMIIQLDQQTIEFLSQVKGRYAP